MRIIGIDPGVNGSGVAVLENGKLVELHTMKTWEIYGFLLTEGEDTTVLVENSNLVRGNWHGRTGRENVGKNKSIAQEIVDYCIATKLNLVELIPDGYSQTYAGKMGKKLFEAETKWKGSSNKDNRAAYSMAQRYYLTNKNR